MKNHTQYQAALRYGLTVAEDGSWGQFQLKGLAGTGRKYTSQWNTAYAFGDGASDEQPFYMRQIFAHWNRNGVRIDLGVIPPVKGKVSATSLDKDGWIRGGRLVLPTLTSGRLEFVAGGLDRLTQPNAFQSWQTPNYFEVEWTQSWSDVDRFELGHVYLENQNYTRGEVRLRSKTVSFAAFELSGEALRNLTTHSNAFDLGASARMSWGVVATEYAYVPEDFGLLGVLSNDFLANGHLLMGTIKGNAPIYTPLGWFIQQHLGEDVWNTKVGVSFSLRYP